MRSFSFYPIGKKKTQQPHPKSHKDNARGQRKTTRAKKDNQHKRRQTQEQKKKNGGKHASSPKTA